MTQAAPSVTDRSPSASGLAAIEALGDPVRRSIFLLLERTKSPLTRRAIAHELDLSPELTRFHLDRLEREGLIAADIGSDGRIARSAGRPSKRYSLARRVEISVPPRRYDLLGRIALRSVRKAPHIAESMRAGAFDVGVDQAHAIEATDGETVLTCLGFEPYRDGSTVRLRNCPFHELVAEDAEFVCGINVRFMEGLATGLGNQLGTPVLDPGPDRCCVAFISEPAAS